MHAPRVLTIVVATLSFTACASTGGVPRQGLARYRTNVISAMEIAQVGASSAYDLVEHLRPYYLRGRTGGLFEAGPIVYQDEIMLGGVDRLRTINAHDVLEIRYVRGEEMLFRSQEASGHQVIQVITRRN